MHTKILRYVIWPVLGIGVGMMAPGMPAWGQEAASSHDGNTLLLDTLLKNGALTQAQYDALVRQEQARQAAQQVAVAVAPPPSGPPIGVPTIAKDKNFTMKIGGRMHVDAGYFDNDKTHIGNGQEIRRARLDISGTIMKDWGYLLSYDWASSDPIKNANISYLGWKNTTVTFGYFKQPFSLEYQDSAKYTEFQERSLLHDTFDPPTRVGVGVEKFGHWGTGEYTAAVSLNGDAVPTEKEKTGDSGVGMDGRLTYAFVHTDDRLFHVGLDAEWRNPGDGEEVSLSTRPNAHLASAMVDTDAIPDVSSESKLGGEVAAVAGPLSVQGQYVAERMRRNTGAGNLDFDGWYLQGLYFLTDDSQASTYKQGRFGGINPSGRFGAWQLGLRYDTVDLIDGGFNGGREANVTAALNWYVNKYIRFSMNYVKVLKLDRPGDVHDGDRPNMLIARMWLGF
jgi:phosphate-selective porin OprO/OprP